VPATSPRNSRYYHVGKKLVGTSMTSNRTQEFLRVHDPVSISFDGPGGLAIGAVRLRSEERGVGLTDPHVLEDAFMINTQLRDYEGRIFLEDRQLDFRRQRRGHSAIFDYRKNWRADLQSGFDCLNFHIEREALSHAFDGEQRKEISNLKAEPGESINDQQLYGLVLAFLPALDRPQEVSRLFMEHFGWTLCSHLAACYGASGKVIGMARGGLASWQEKRAKDLIEASLDGDISVETLAEECGLSRAHFSRCFRVSTGVPPHRWLLNRRVARAKGLLVDWSLPISEIAARCGFADQSHLSRVFKKLEGETPMAWRRKFPVTIRNG
jgi:AraC family transcriptional regulator